jgi:lysophospholipase L1-like esterase
VTRAKLVAAAVVAAATAVPVSEGAASQRYYLALGDSIAYGLRPAKVTAGLPPTGFRTGYVDLFAARLRKFSTKLHVVNYSCPGEAAVRAEPRSACRR